MNHLTKQQLADFESQLAERQSELLAQLRGEIGNADAQREAQAGEGALDAADQAQTDTMTLREQGMAGHYGEELADVQAARARIAGGEFTVCVACDSAISEARLRAYPTAKRCLQCQQVHERRVKQA